MPNSAKAIRQQTTTTPAAHSSPLWLAMEEGLKRLDGSKRSRIVRVASDEKDVGWVAFGKITPEKPDFGLLEEEKI